MSRSEGHRCFKCGVINRLENLSVEHTGFFAMERNIHHHKYIRESLDADTDGAVAQIARPRFISGVIINIDDLVQIIYDEGGDALELCEVKRGGCAPPNDALGS